MKFLPLGRDIVNLQLVCKEWGRSLKHHAYCRYLVDENNYSFLAKHRLKVYKAICTPPFSESVYKRMVLEIPDYTEHT